jgi:copper homeostasis protein
MILEVIACSLEDAIAAEHGGATRLEVISDFERDGLTPPLDLVDAIAATVRIPIRVILRARADYASGHPADLTRLQEMATALTLRPIDGVVVGFLRAGRVDVPTVHTLLDAMPGLKATFHRAFEAADDPPSALRDIKTLAPVDCILTSGGRGAWHERVARLAALRVAALPEITVLVGGGVTADAIDEVCAATQIRAFHLGRAVREPASPAGVVRSDRVADLRRRIERA